MSDFHLYQYGLVALIFVWSGFVRSGIGFGGAALSLPFLLLVDDSPLVYLPLIAVHLLVFSSLTIFLNQRKAKSQSKDKAQGEQLHSEQTSSVDWPYVRKVLAIIIIPKLLGVFGLITLPASIMSGIIFVIVSIYAITYIANRPFRSNKPYLDRLFLIIGGYTSGLSLTGAPLMTAVIANHVEKHRLRDTLFALWFILVTIKMTAFIYVGVDLQLIHHLWLLPCAAIGHVIGLHFHERILQAESGTFYRILGCVLLTVNIIGLIKLTS